MAAPPAAASLRGALDVQQVRAEFPALAAVPGRPSLCYLDSASTTLRPRAVLAAQAIIDTREVGNVHRAVHPAAAGATERYEAARDRVRAFLGAASRDEIIFCSGTTAAINLVAQTFGRQRVHHGDEVLASVLEHHANLVPWHMLCAERGAALRPIPLDGEGRVDLAALRALLSPRTRVVALSHASNVLGTVPEMAEVVALAHARGAAVVVDGAQAVAHGPVDVTALGCDFYCFSGHKLFGPTGAGVLYGRRELLAAMPPWQGGGHMIRSVGFDQVTYAEPPDRFEAGTPPIAAVAGLGAALEWLEAIGWAALRGHEGALVEHALAVLPRVPGLRLFGPASGRVPVLSFALAGAHPHDVATILAEEGIAVRGGHHCAQPLHRRFGMTASVRASAALYNTADDVDVFLDAVSGIRSFFGVAS